MWEFPAYLKPPPKKYYAIKAQGIKVFEQLSNTTYKTKINKYMKN